MRMYMRYCKNMIPFQQPRLVEAHKKCSTYFYMQGPVIEQNPLGGSGNIARG